MAFFESLEAWVCPDAVPDAAALSARQHAFGACPGPLQAAKSPK
jgi:hypothetical protein